MSLAWLLGLAALLLAAVGRRRAAWVLLLVQVGLLWLAAAPWVAERLALWLERDYPPMALAATPTADVVVVLGGAVRQVGEPAVENLTRASDRLLRAARLYRAGKVEAVLAVGGNLSWMREAAPESALMRELLVEWGVPRDAILLETRSQTTRENALFAAEILAAQDWERVLLVTSAGHMRRAVGAFRAAGVEVIPSPTDYAVLTYAAPAAMNEPVGVTGQLQAGPSDRAAAPPSRGKSSAGAMVNIAVFLPTAEALARTTTVMRELLGRIYYRWRGWM